MTTMIENKERRRRAKTGEVDDGAAPVTTQPAPDLTPTPSSSFFKSPTAPAGKTVGRPQPPAHMIRR